MKKGNKSPHQLPFDLTTIKDLDYGVINAAFKAHLARVVKDCEDRPLDDKARTVVIKFILKPNIDKEGGTGEVDGVMVQTELYSDIPTHRTREYQMLATQDGGLKFNPDLPAEPKNATLYQEPFEDKPQQ